ncbi:MAG: hypothetical protein ACR2M0_03560 [Chloroflexia bacterium]
MDLDAPGIEREGYTTAGNRYWICKQCYHDFHAMFGWQVAEAAG